MIELSLCLKVVELFGEKVSGLRLWVLWEFIGNFLLLYWEMARRMISELLTNYKIYLPVIQLRKSDYIIMDNEKVTNIKTI